MTTSSAFRLIPSLVVLALLGCDGDTGINKDTHVVDDCTAPTVTPLENQIVTLGETVTMPGAGEKCNSVDYDLIWSMDSAPLDSVQSTGDLNVTDPTAVYWAPDMVGDYVVSLYLVDSTGNKSAVTVAVITVVSGNGKPVADCGENQSALVGDRVDLDGSGSSDPEGAAVTYEWALSSAPACSGLSADDVFNGDQVVASTVPDCAGTYVVSLVVSDGENYSDADYCSITVGSDNAPPVADAGQTTTESPCTAPDFHLDGWGSYDPDGDAITYSWSLLSAPSGSAGYFSGATDKADPYYHWDIPGDYTFQLQVCDPTQCGAPDIVTFTFVDPSTNARPVANAGADQTIDNDPDCATASYVWTCDDCPADKVTLDGSASIDEVDGDELDFLWTDSSGDLTLDSPKSPETVANTPSFASTYNTTITKTWSVDLTVSDCLDSDTDSVIITYTCTGTY